MNDLAQTTLLFPFALLPPLFPNRPSKVVTSTSIPTKFHQVLELYKYDSYFVCRCTSLMQRDALVQFLTQHMLSILADPDPWPYAQSAKAFLVWCSSNPNVARPNAA